MGGCMRTERFLQRGVSLTGLLFWSVVIGILALIAMKLFPLYNEKMKVDFAMEKVLSEPNIGNWGKVDLAKAIMKQFEVSDVDRWTELEFFKLLRVERPKAGQNRVMSLEYEIRGPLCCNLDIILNYQNSHELPSGSAE